MRLLISGVLLLMLVAVAHAQSYGPPTYSVGDEWTYTNRTQKVVKVDGESVVMTGVNPRCPTCLYYLDRNLLIQKITDENGAAPDSSNLGFMPVGSNWKFWDFPLEVKKQWNFSAQGFFQRSTSNYIVDLAVEAYEDVKTKAGTFKAFRVRRDWTIRSHFGRDFKWNDTVWFAPDVKAPVKFTSSNPNSQEWELTAYTLK